MITLNIKKLITGIVILLIVGGGIFYFVTHDTEAKPSVQSAAQSEKINIADLKYTQTYEVPEYGITFNYPKGFTIGEMEDGKGDEITVQTTDGKAGVQIKIQPTIVKNATLTIEDVVKNIPSLTIRESQPVEIGEGGKGVAFVAESPQFGISREVWFVFNGNMYQMSTYIEYDDILRNILNSWQFQTQ